MFGKIWFNVTTAIDLCQKTVSTSFLLIFSLFQGHNFLQTGQCYVNRPFSYTEAVRLAVITDL
jgi:hypothetical protein